jgi:hypothetical protein|tara:strand:- start:234 stop:374 length:141 start_codon:yes stop_codon:yes gene_type:complete
MKVLSIISNMIIVGAFGYVLGAGERSSPSVDQVAVEYAVYQAMNSK